MDSKEREDGAAKPAAVSAAPLTHKVCQFGGLVEVLHLVDDAASAAKGLALHPEVLRLVAVARVGEDGVYCGEEGLWIQLSICRAISSAGG
jgi:hypothetical protein